MYEIIDAHAHIYPNKIAAKATKNVGLFYDIEMDTETGTVDRLLSESRRAGVSRTVISSVATTVHQVSSINGYMIETSRQYPEFIAFMTLHPDMTEDEIGREIAYCKENGVKGIKLHPDFQKFRIDDKEVYKIYRKADGVLPILFHTGDRRYDYSQPQRLAKVAADFPGLTVIAAHFGGYSVWDETGCYKGLKNVYFDTSSSLMFISPEKAKGFIDYFGEDRFFFGTDFPMWKPDDEIKRFISLDLTERQREMIFAENFKRVFNV